MAKKQKLSDAELEMNEMYAASFNKNETEKDLEFKKDPLLDNLPKDYSPETWNALANAGYNFELRQDNEELEKSYEEQKMLSKDIAETHEQIDKEFAPAIELGLSEVPENYHNALSEMEVENQNLMKQNMELQKQNEVILEKLELAKAHLRIAELEKLLLEQKTFSQHLKDMLLTQKENAVSTLSEVKHGVAEFGNSVKNIPKNAYETARDKIENALAKADMHLNKTMASYQEKNMNAYVKFMDASKALSNKMEAEHDKSIQSMKERELAKMHLKNSFRVMFKREKITEEQALSNPKYVKKTEMNKTSKSLYDTIKNVESKCQAQAKMCADKMVMHNSKVVEYQMDKNSRFSNEPDLNKEVIKDKNKNKNRAIIIENIDYEH